MPDVEFVNLLGVLAIAVGAPLLLGFAPRVRVPAVVLEIVLGIAVGPSMLGWLEADLAVEIVALLGLAMLLFLAGLEIDVHRLRGRLLGYAVAGYLISVVVGCGAGTLLVRAAWLDDSLLLSLVFSESGGSTGARLLLLGVFVGTVVLVGLAVALSTRSMRLGDVLSRLQDSTAEIRVRAAALVCAGLASVLIFPATAASLGLRGADRDGDDHRLAFTRHAEPIP